MSHEHDEHLDEPLWGLPPDLVIGPSADALPLVGEVNWGMDVIGVEYLRTITDGEGFKIGGVDTGIDPDHPIIAPNFAKAKDHTRSSNGYLDANGHGSHISGTIFGADPRIGVGAKFRGYHGKGLSNSGSGSMTDLLNAIEWCLSEGCTVVSNSWGGGTSIGSGTQNRLREWAERGAWLIFAAGNSGGGTNQTDAPGNSEHVLNVAALSQNLSPASFTSAGAKIDTAGPGVNIWSARPDGGFQQMSGTSMATPFVAGVLGLLRRAMEIKGVPIPNVYELRKQLAFSSTDVHTPGDDVRTGPGYATPALLRMLLEPRPLPIGGNP